MRRQSTLKKLSKLTLTLAAAGLIHTAKAQTFTHGNLAVFSVATATANNTSGSIIELNKTTAAQSAVNTFTINGTSGTNALRFSGSATSTGYLTNTNDGSLLCFNGAVTTNTTSNINTITPRGVGTFNQSGSFSVAATYTGSSGNQTRSSTSINNSNWFIADQGGMYTNSATLASPSGNFRSVKAFGGTVYVSTASSSTATIQINTLSSPSGSTLTPLTGLTNNANLQDFYLISSGSNGSAYDVLYVLSATSNTAGTITKFSLVSGSWVANGSYTTTFGGFGLAAEANGTGAYLYVSTGQGALAGNTLLKMTDAAGYNATINITTASNITLYTSAAGTTIKGVAFAPGCNAPTVSVSPNNPVCAGASLTFTASATGSSLSYAWVGPDSFTSSVQNATVANTTTASAGVYTLTVTNGCGSTASATTSVIVNPAPNNYSVTGGGSYCADGTGVAIGLSNSDAGVNYQLVNGGSPVGSAVAGTGSALSFSLQTAAGTYTVLATDGTTSCSSGMNGSAAVVITPTVTPSLSISASSGIICSGTNVTFSATATNSGSSPVYQWLLNGNAVGSNAASYASNTLVNGDMVSATFTSNAACATATAVLSNTITINVTSSVTPSLSIASVQGNTVCAGTAVTFSAVPVNGGSTPSYQWAVNGTVTAVTSDTYTNNTLNDQDVISATLTSSDGCASPATATESFTISVTPLVTPSVSIASNPSGVTCAGAPVTFTATAANAGTPVYQWTKNGSNAGSNSNIYTDASLANNDMIACVITSTVSCSTANTASASITATVNTIATPTISGTFSFCPSSSTMLDAGAGYASYSWSNGAVTQTVSVSSSGIYSVSVSNGTCTASSQTMNVSMSAGTAQPANFTSASSSVQQGQAGVVYTVPNDPSVTYAWNYSGTGATINGSSNSVTVDFSSSATNGTLSVAANGSCGASTPTTIYINIYQQPVFTAGNLVLLQTSGNTSKASSAITLKEISTSGANGVSFNIPSGGPTPLQTSGVFGGSEGFLTTSTDQKYLVLAGYATSASFGDITATSASIAPRAVGLVYPSGFYQQVAASNSFYDMNDIRGAVSDGTNFWASGASVAGTDGIDYFAPGAQAGLGAGATPPKGYAIRIFNGTLYYSTQKAGPSNSATQLGIFSMGSLPTSGNPTPVQLINTGSTIVEDFSINPSTNICYIAVNLNNATGGIQKWTKSGSTWTLAYTLGTGVSNVGAYGLVVDYSGANPVIYATTFDAGGNRVIKITDAGMGSAAVTILPATPNVFYKGIAFAPQAYGTPLVDLTVSQDTASEALATTVTVTAFASFPVTGTQTVALNVSGTGITSGDYVLSNTVITIPAGNTSGSVTFKVVDDAVVEALIETATLTISNPSSGIAPGNSLSQKISIRDNEANLPPTIVMNTASTTNYIDNGANSSPASPFSVSSTMNDPTDPAITMGIDFTLNDAETPVSLTLSVVSSNTAVVTNANINVTGTALAKNVKIIPTGIGYSDITLSLTDGINITAYTIHFASSDPSPNLTINNTFWHTGLSDASNAIAIDDNYYMTGDDELDYINVYARNHSGLQVASFDATSQLNLPDPSSPEVDIEAGAESPKTAGRSFWIGSMSNGKSPFANKPNRDRLFATHHIGTGAATVISFAGYSAIRSSLLTWGDAHGYDFSNSAAAGKDPKSFDGFSAEGMCFAPDSTTLWIALRAPLVPTNFRTKAVIAPILNFETWFNNGNQTGNPAFGTPIELDLNMNGFRDLIRLSNGTYIIIAGSPLDNGGSSEIFKWTGNPADAPIHVPSSAEGVLNMEGAMEVHNSGNLSFTKLQVITDNGAAVLYNDNNEAKDFGDLNLRKFRSDVLTGLDLTICTNYSVAINTNGNTTFCAGDSVKLTASASATSYSWSTGVNTPSVTVKNTGSYSVTATNTVSGCSATATKSVTVNALPNVQAHAAETVICSGQSDTLKATGALTYTWTNGISNNTAFTPTASAAYAVSGTDNNNCINTASVSITVNQPPATPSITQNGDVISSSVSGTSYQWFESGNAISGATAQNYTITAPGDYAVEVFNAFNCSAISNTVHAIPNTSGINSKAAGAEIKVYPNPNSGQFMVETESLPAELFIYDMQGKLVKSEILNTNKLTIRTQLQAGIYILHVKTEEDVYVQRIMITQ